MNEWQNFFIAQAGAAAALAGLIFVGVSINLTRILSLSRLPDRALLPLILLVTILILSSLLPVPGQPVFQVGLEVLGLGSLVWITTTRIDLGIMRNTDLPYRRKFILNMVITQLAVLPYPVAGIVLVTGNINGLYGVVAGILFSFIKAVLDAWVLLIEINR
jgi:hypothetical protein